MCTIRTGSDHVTLQQMATDYDLRLEAGEATDSIPMRALDRAISELERDVEAHEYEEGDTMASLGLRY